jgi:hypothetical protein
MKRNIAVERNLTPVKYYLTGKGYNVDSIDINKEYTKGMDKYDAIVVTGMNSNFLGIQDTNTKAVVIEAKGLTSEQVFNELEKRLH